MHAIVSFDIDKTQEAAMHHYDGTAQTVSGVKRTKVPVKDGRSQSAFIKQAKEMQ
jgi:hypothetical protein